MPDLPRHPSEAADIPAFTRNKTAIKEIKFSPNSTTFGLSRDGMVYILRERIILFSGEPTTYEWVPIPVAAPKA